MSPDPQATSAPLTLSKPDAPHAPFALAPGAVTEAMAVTLLQGRRMNAVRGILHAQRHDCLVYLNGWKPGLPDMRQLVLDQLRVIDDALAEVEAAERGCGGGDGECTCLCHAGLRAPDPNPMTP